MVEMQDHQHHTRMQSERQWLTRELDINWRRGGASEMLRATE